ncbi:MAG: redoxin domain-containing protein [Synechococcales cyanobacterium T60_A2020_003]|nr:redoxin domain-containing protein [Synechococcales cyanobacterium T60_A2020_003]
MLEVGDPAPWFTLPSDSNPNYHFDTVAGHYVVMFFFGSSQHPASQAALNQFLAHSEFFRDRQIPFFGVSIDPTDEALGDVVSTLSYCKLIWDFEGKASRMYGVCSPVEAGDRYQPTVFILNENLRVLHRFFLESDTPLVDQVMAAAAALPPLPPPQMDHRQAPVLFIPNVFDRNFCHELIAQYHRSDVRQSGFMRDIDGKTVEVMDYGFKRRRDWLLQESDLLQTINHLILRRIKAEKNYKTRISGGAIAQRPALKGKMQITEYLNIFLNKPEVFGIGEPGYSLHHRSIRNSQTVSQSPSQSSEDKRHET